MSWAERVELRGEVDSTMAVAAELARAGACHGTTVVAEAQRHGRGRRGRSWSSPRGAGLWMTTILRPPSSLPWQAARSPASAWAAVPSLGVVVGIALARAVHGLGARRCRLKWPNDLMVGERKLAGILLEADQQTAADPLVLAGIGLNLQPREQALAWLPKAVACRYVGLADATDAGAAGAGTSLDVIEIRAAVLAELESCYVLWLQDGLESLGHEWERFDALRDQVVRAEGEQGPIEGLAVGIGPLGELRVRTEAAVHCVVAGEVERLHWQNTHVCDCNGARPAAKT